MKTGTKRIIALALVLAMALPATAPTAAAAEAEAKCAHAAMLEEMGESLRTYHLPDYAIPHSRGGGSTTYSVINPYTNRFAYDKAATQGIAAAAGEPPENGFVYNNLLATSKTTVVPERTKKAVYISDFSFIEDDNVDKGKGKDNWFSLTLSTDLKLYRYAIDAGGVEVATRVDAYCGTDGIFADTVAMKTALNGRIVLQFDTLYGKGYSFSQRKQSRPLGYDYSNDMKKPIRENAEPEFVPISIPLAGYHIDYWAAPKPYTVMTQFYNCGYSGFGTPNSSFSNAALYVRDKKAPVMTGLYATTDPTGGLAKAGGGATEDKAVYVVADFDEPVYFNGEPTQYTYQDGGVTKRAAAYPRMLVSAWGENGDEYLYADYVGIAHNSDLVILDDTGWDMGERVPATRHIFKVDLSRMKYSSFTINGISSLEIDSKLCMNWGDSAWYKNAFCDYAGNPISLPEGRLAKSVAYDGKPLTIERVDITEEFNSKSAVTGQNTLRVTLTFSEQIIQQTNYDLQPVFYLNNFNNPQGYYPYRGGSYTPTVDEMGKNGAIKLEGPMYGSATPVRLTGEIQTSGAVQSDAKGNYYVSPAVAVKLQGKTVTGGIYYYRMVDRLSVEKQQYAFLTAEDLTREGWAAVPEEGRISFEKLYAGQFVELLGLRAMKIPAGTGPALGPDGKPVADATRDGFTVLYAGATSAVGAQGDSTASQNAGKRASTITYLVQVPKDKGWDVGKVFLAVGRGADGQPLNYAKDGYTWDGSGVTVLMKGKVQAGNKVISSDTNAYPDENNSYNNPNGFFGSWNFNETTGEYTFVPGRQYSMVGIDRHAPTLTENPEAVEQNGNRFVIRGDLYTAEDKGFTVGDPLEGSYRGDPAGYSASGVDMVKYFISSPTLPLTVTPAAGEDIPLAPGASHAFFAGEELTVSIGSDKPDARGAVIVQAIAADRAGNTATAQSQYFFDVRAPKAEILGHSRNSGGGGSVIMTYKATLTDPVTYRADSYHTSGRLATVGAVSYALCDKGLDQPPSDAVWTPTTPGVETAGTPDPSMKTAAATKTYLLEVTCPNGETVDQNLWLRYVVDGKDYYHSIPIYIISAPMNATLTLPEDMTGAPGDLTFQVTSETGTYVVFEAGERRYELTPSQANRSVSLRDNVLQDAKATGTYRVRVYATNMSGGASRMELYSGTVNLFNLEPTVTAERNQYSLSTATAKGSESAVAKLNLTISSGALDTVFDATRCTVSLMNDADALAALPLNLGSEVGGHSTAEVDLLSLLEQAGNPTGDYTLKVIFTRHDGTKIECLCANTTVSADFTVTNLTGIRGKLTVYGVGTTYEEAEGTSYESDIVYGAGNTVAFTADAKSALSAGETLEYAISDRADSADTWYDDTDSMTLELAGSTITGEYILFRVKDDKGNLSPVVSRRLAKDETPPTGFVTKDTDQLIYPDGEVQAVTLTLESAADDYSGQDSIWVKAGYDGRYVPFAAGTHTVKRTPEDKSRGFELVDAAGNLAYLDVATKQFFDENTMGAMYRLGDYDTWIQGGSLVFDGAKERYSCWAHYSELDLRFQEEPLLQIVDNLTGGRPSLDTILGKAGSIETVFTASPGGYDAEKGYYYFDVVADTPVWDTKTYGEKLYFDLILTHVSGVKKRIELAIVLTCAGVEENDVTITFPDRLPHNPLSNRVLLTFPQPVKLLSHVSAPSDTLKNHQLVYLDNEGTYEFVYQTADGAFQTVRKSFDFSYFIGRGEHTMPRIIRAVTGQGVLITFDLEGSSFNEVSINGGEALDPEQGYLFRENGTQKFAFSGPEDAYLEYDYVEAGVVQPITPEQKVLKVSYSVTEESEGPVVARLVYDKSAATALGADSQIFRENGTHTFKVHFSDGSEGEITATVANIKKPVVNNFAPQFVGYDFFFDTGSGYEERDFGFGEETMPTCIGMELRVRATDGDNNSLKLVNVQNATVKPGDPMTLVVTANAVVSYGISDGKHTTTQTITVKNIWKTRPGGTVRYARVGLTRMKAYIVPADGSTLASYVGLTHDEGGWHYLFGNNGTYDFTLRTAAGVTGTVQAKAEGLVTGPPALISSTYSTKQPTAKSVRVVHGFSMNLTSAAIEVPDSVTAPTVDIVGQELILTYTQNVEAGTLTVVGENDQKTDIDLAAHPVKNIDTAGIVIEAKQLETDPGTVQVEVPEAMYLEVKGSAGKCSFSIDLEPGKDPETGENYPFVFQVAWQETLTLKVWDGVGNETTATLALTNLASTMPEFTAALTYTGGTYKDAGEKIYRQAASVAVTPNVDGTFYLANRAYVGEKGKPTTIPIAAEGTYMLAFIDAYMNRCSYELRVDGLDGNAPVVTCTQSAVAQFAPGTTLDGVKAFFGTKTTTVDNKTGATLSYAVKDSGGGAVSTLTAGKTYTITITATDGVGNASAITRYFSVNTHGAAGLKVNGVVLNSGVNTLKADTLTFSDIPAGYSLHILRGRMTAAQMKYAPVLTAPWSYQAGAGFYTVLLRDAAWNGTLYTIYLS